MRTGGPLEAIERHTNPGAIGSIHATTVPIGSFARSGHDRSHAHMIQIDPTNGCVLYTDLGQDRIYVYSFDGHSGRLTASTACPFVLLPDGDGPRHFAFHPNGHWMYSLQEEASTVVLFDFAPKTAELTARRRSQRFQRVLRAPASARRSRFRRTAASSMRQIACTTRLPCFRSARMACYLALR